MVIIHMNEVPRLGSREDLTFHPGACLKSWSPSRFTRTSLGVTFLSFTFFFRNEETRHHGFANFGFLNQKYMIKHFGFHWVFLDVQKHIGFRCKTPATVACKAPRTANQVLPVTVASCCPQREQPRIPPGLKPKLLDWGEGHMRLALCIKDGLTGPFWRKIYSHIPEDGNFQHPRGI